MAEIDNLRGDDGDGVPIVRAFKGEEAVSSALTGAHGG